MYAATGVDSAKRGASGEPSTNLDNGGALRRPAQCTGMYTNTSYDSTGAQPSNKNGYLRIGGMGEPGIRWGRQ